MKREYFQAVVQKAAFGSKRSQHERQVVIARVGQMLLAFVQPLLALVSDNGLKRLPWVWLGLHGSQHVFKAGHQSIGALGLLHLIGQEILLSGGFQLPHQLDQKLCGIIQRLGILLPDQDHRQGIAFTRRDSSHFGHIQRSCFVGELSPLGHGN